MAELNWNLGLTPNYSEGFRYAEAGQAQQRAQQQQADEAAKKQALSAYAQNPQTGLAGVIATDPRTGIALQANQRQEDASQRTAEQAEKERALKAKRAFGEAIVHVPKGARAGIYDSLGAIIPGIEPQTLEELRPQIDNDDFWKALVGKYDDELKVVAPGSTLMRGTQEVYRAADKAPTPPAGYRAVDNGALEAIPGGPADPRVAGTLAGARRKPGGGSGSKRQAHEMSEAELRAIAGI